MNKSVNKRVKSNVKRLIVIIAAVFLYGLCSIYTSLWQSHYSYTNKIQDNNNMENKINDNKIEESKDKSSLKNNSDEVEEKNIEAINIKEETDKVEEKITEVPKLNENTKEETKSVFSNSNSKANKYTFPTIEPVRAKPSNDKYLVTVSVSQQKVYVYKNDNKIKTMACSTGLPGKNSETPIGKYKINDYYGDSFYSGKYKQGAKYWVGFIGSEFLFHSVPTQKDGQVIREEADKIGLRASHGCVRLDIEDSFWFYETVPKGADVVIEA